MLFRLEYLYVRTYISMCIYKYVRVCNGLIFVIIPAETAKPPQNASRNGKWDRYRALLKNMS